ncbi:tail fiber domain-containing protein [Flavobacterium silvaticum]|uniref:Peptidase S74 domain-containing protein n=1 Tax=Flavobacterium silvaticum TaxID=1852020 RepID=A0A972JHF4_9FLAO|nr:tail fiber domain-containing protein [Flavobacterium silvaticum]NMH29186.1 hypothetical protein [Flavobacterium silvaticum]
MEKRHTLLLVLFTFFWANAQVGINTTDPKALLDIPVTNAAAPSNTDGILIPRVTAFPAVNPTAAQNGMMVFLTQDVGSNLPGFYYWDGVYNIWVKIATGSFGATLDQSYDFGGPGSGSSIWADSGPVLISGYDGLHSTGFLGAGISFMSGSGPRMTWNPRKAAFRVGHAYSDQWDDANVGLGSFAAGDSGIASGEYATALGRFSQATGYSSFAMGPGTIASGDSATAMGYSATASGANATSLGLGPSANGSGSVAMGIGSGASGTGGISIGNAVLSQTVSEVALGGFNTTYIAGLNGSVTWNATDRIFSIGNGTSNTLRSNALTILKNGLATLPSVTNALIDAEPTGKAIVTKEWVSANSGSLDRAYDFGGSGLGRTITADGGAVTIAGTDGLISTGTANTGAVITVAGTGVRMLWNPRKAAFRVGGVIGTNWDDANTGANSFASGESTRASGQYSTALGKSNIASGYGAIAMGENTNSTGTTSSSFGYQTTASGTDATAMGTQSVASGSSSLAVGNTNTASGNASAAIGTAVTAGSLNEMALGRFSTTYTPGTNGANAFNLTDRILSVGNGSDASNRSNALIILKNGLATLPSVTNTLIAAEPTGKAIVTKEYLAANGGATLDEAYDHGGAGAGRSITADAGAVSIIGTDGFQVTGTNNAGATLSLSGAGTRMFFYPRKSAFRAGLVTASQWDDVNIGSASVAFGSNSAASGTAATALGGNTIASAEYSTALGFGSTASGNTSFAAGQNTSALSFSETTLGRFNTTYTPLSASAWNTADRLFSVGNGTSATVRSNALTILKNGLATLPSVTNALINAETTGKAIVTKEWVQANGGWGLTGNSGTTAGTNFIGTTDNEDLIFKRNNLVSGQIRNTLSAFGRSALANSEDNQNTAFGYSGLYQATTGNFNSAFGYMSLMDSNGSYNSAFGCQSAHNITEGQSNCAFGQLSLGGTTTGMFNSGFGRHTLLTNTTGSDNSALGYNADVSTGNLTNATAIGANAYVTASNTIVLGSIAGINEATDNVRVGIGLTAPGGQFQLSLDQGRKPGTNTWTIASDERLKTIHGSYQKGLPEIIRLNPISYNYKNVRDKTFDAEVLKTEYSGFSAQQVKEIFPEAVGTDDDGYLNLNIHPILIASVNALKELDQKNKNLENENAQLKNQITKQQELLEDLLERVSALEKK